MVSMPGLGRIKRFDDRSRSFPVTAALPREAEGLQDKTWRRPRAMDQGTTPQCVGYSLWGALNTQPLTSTYSYDVRRAYTPAEIYAGAQKNDYWAGEDYDGSSVLGGARFLRSAGAIREYRWAFGIEQVLQALSWVGPVVVGTDWLRNMFTAPNPETGYFPKARYALDVAGPMAGGHAYELHGLRVKQEVVIATNSWSTEWGDNGRCYLTFSDLDLLLQAEGEAVVLL